MPRTRKRPCRICQRWFYPDPRVGERQRACSNPECQAARRQKTQANWRAENPGYAAAYRIDQRHDSTAPEPERLRAPAPLNQLPWDLAKDEFGGKGADFIAVMSRLLLNAAKDQSSGYPIDATRLPGNNPALPQKTRSQPEHTETRGASTGVSSTGPPPGASPGPPPGTIPASVGVVG
jgi:hypothetical protein